MVYSSKNQPLLNLTLITANLSCDVIIKLRQSVLIRAGKALIYYLLIIKETKNEKKITIFSLPFSLVQ